MTKARIKLFCRANNFNLGYFEGEIVFLDQLRIEIMLCIYIVTTFV